MNFTQMGLFQMDVKPLRPPAADDLDSIETFDEVISNMLGNSWKLSKEDEETILRISNKIIA